MWNMSMEFYAQQKIKMWKRKKTWLICRHVCKAGYLLCANTQDVLLGSSSSAEPHNGVPILQLAGCTKKA